METLTCARFCTFNSPPMKILSKVLFCFQQEKLTNVKLCFLSLAIPGLITPTLSEREENKVLDTGQSYGHWTRWVDFGYQACGSEGYTQLLLVRICVNFKLPNRLKMKMFDNCLLLLGEFLQKAFLILDPVFLRPFHRILLWESRPWPTNKSY